MSGGGDSGVAKAASSMARRLAPTAYRNSSGDANGPGRRPVPVTSALLEGLQNLPWCCLAGPWRPWGRTRLWRTPAVVVECVAPLSSPKREPTTGPRAGFA